MAHCFIIQNTVPIFIPFNELRLAKLLFSPSLYLGVDQLVGHMVWVTVSIRTTTYQAIPICVATLAYFHFLFFLKQV